MKKALIIIGMTVLCCMTIGAQTFNFTGIELNNERTKKKNVYEWEQFIVAHYAYGFAPQHSFGLTYGRVKLCGWYVNMMLGTGFHYKYDERVDNNTLYHLSNYYFDGKISHNRVSFTSGLVIRCVIPLYFYAGIGYGYRSMTARTEDGKWVRICSLASPHHGINYEAGIMGSIKGFTISAGYSNITDGSGDKYLSEIKIGLGYTFKTKKKS